MPRFARFKKHGLMEAITLNLDHIISITDQKDGSCFLVMSTGMGGVPVEGNLDHVESILEAEYGQVLDAVPGDH